MDFQSMENNTTRRIAALKQRLEYIKEHDYYFYNQPVEEMLEGAKVRVKGRVMGMHASY